MPRDVTDEDGTAWSCIQAFAGLGGAAEKRAETMGAARVGGEEDKVHVVCTPSGGAHSVRLALPGDWEAELSDAQLLDAIRTELAKDG